MPSIHTTVLAVGSAVLALTLTACSSESPSSAPRATVTVTATPTSPAGSPSSSPSSTPSSTSSTVVSTPRCTTADLRVRLGTADAALGTEHFTLSLTNTASHACRTGGFGGVSLVGAGHGVQLGAPADRADAGRARSFVLRPGQRADAQLALGTAENYPRATCRPAPADGFRVYPPNETHSTYVARPSTACRNPAVHLLQLTPYQPVG